MTQKICDDCGLPISLCNKIAMVSIRYGRRRSVGWRDSVRRFRPIVEERLKRKNGFEAFEALRKVK